MKKFLLFFFVVFLSNIFQLLALVSEFNCFLRSRCSTEMWCPDDIGRDSCDWFGPPAWGRACFNSPEWGWRLLACENGASPDCIIVVVVVVVECVVECVVVVLLLCAVCCCCVVVV